MIKTVALALSISFFTRSACVRTHDLSSNDHKPQEVNFDVQYAPLPSNNRESQIEQESLLPEIYAVNIDMDDSFISTQKTNESAINRKELKFLYGSNYMDIFKPINGMPPNSEMYKVYSNVYKPSKTYPREINHYVLVHPPKLTTSTSPSELRTSTSRTDFSRNILKSSQLKRVQDELNSRNNRAQKSLPSEDRHPLLLNIAHNHLSNILRKPRGSSYKVNAIMKVRGGKKLSNNAHYFVPELAVYRVQPKNANS